MIARPLLGFFLLFCLGTSLCAGVSVGDTRAQVREKLGDPRGVARTGNVESLMYDEVRITLRDGYVVEIYKQTAEVKNASTQKDIPEAVEEIYSETVEEEAPQAAPRGWLLDYREASELARQSKLPIFALFTGSDWCPPCIQYQNTIGDRAAFLDYAQGKVILLKVDFPQKTPQMDQIRNQNRQLADRHGVRGFPTFLLLDAGGDKIASFSRPRISHGEEAMDRYIESMDQMLSGASASPLNHPWFRTAIILLVIYFAIRWLRR